MQGDQLVKKYLVRWLEGAIKQCLVFAWNIATSIIALSFIYLHTLVGAILMSGDLNEPRGRCVIIL